VHSLHHKDVASIQQTLAFVPLLLIGFPMKIFWHCGFCDDAHSVAYNFAEK
jgi:hypothetical protein